MALADQPIQRATLTSYTERFVGVDAIFTLALAGVRTGTPIKLELRAVVKAAKSGTKPQTENGVVIGTLSGRASADGGFVVDPIGGVTKNVLQPSVQAEATDRVVALRVESPAGRDPAAWFFRLPDVDESARKKPYKGRQWDVFIGMTAPTKSRSNTVEVAFDPHALGAGSQATYDYHRFNDVTFYRNGAANALGGKTESPSDDEGSAFTDLVAAITEAKHFVFVADWSFHPLFRVTRGGPDGPNEFLAQTIGKLLLDKATDNSAMLVGILVWQQFNGFVTSHTPAPQDEQSGQGDKRLEYINNNTPRPANFFWRAANRAGSLSDSHHQKFVVLDCAVKGTDKRGVKAFFGGLDLTKGRWDWDLHLLRKDDAGAKEFLKTLTVPTSPVGKQKYDDWYSGEFQTDSTSAPDMPREPWHDIHGAISGPAAWDFLREWVGRWNADGIRDEGNFVFKPQTKDELDAGVPPIVLPSVRMVNDLYAAVNGGAQWCWSKGIKTATGGTSLDFLQQSADYPLGDTKKPRWSAQIVRSILSKGWTMQPPAPTEGASDPTAQGRVPPYASHFKWGLQPNGRDGGDGDFECSIQDAYLRAISLAEKFIFIETQYFISSSDGWMPKDAKRTVRNRIAQALCEKILAKHRSDEAFHVYIITPMYPEGPPDAGNVRTQRYYEWLTMEYMVRELDEKIGKSEHPEKSWSDYLSCFFPARNGPPLPSHSRTDLPPGQLLLTISDMMRVPTHLNAYETLVNATFMDAAHAKDDEERWHKEAFFGQSAAWKWLPIPRSVRVRKNNRYMVYVHSKFMIIDDVYAILGSANLNERSLAGDRDTEICTQMWPESHQFVSACEASLREFRKHLFLEHFGPIDMDDPKAAQDAGARNYEKYRTGIELRTSGSPGQCIALPLVLEDDGGTKRLRVKRPTPEDDSTDYLFDAAERKQVWKWWSELADLALVRTASE